MEEPERRAFKFERDTWIAACLALLVPIGLVLMIAHYQPKHFGPHYHHRFNQNPVDNQ